MAGKVSSVEWGSLIINLSFSLFSFLGVSDCFSLESASDFFLFFLVKSFHILLVLPQAAQLRIHFLLRKIGNVAPPRGTRLRTPY